MWCFTCGPAASCCTDGCSNINTPWAGALQSSARSRVLPQQKVRYTPHYVWVPHRGEQPDLIGCVLALQGTHLCNVCLLDSIHLAIGVPLDAVGTAIGTLTKVLLDLQQVDMFESGVPLNRKSLTETPSDWPCPGMPSRAGPLCMAHLAMQCRYQANWRRNSETHI